MEILDSSLDTPNPENVKYRDLALRTALTLTGITVVLNLVFYITGLSETMMKNKSLNSANNLFLFGLTFYFIFTALKNHRKNDLGGWMSTGRGIGFGSLTGLIGGVLSAIWTYAFMSWIAPEMMAQITQVAAQQMADRGLDEDEVERQMGYAKMFMTPAFFAVIVVFFSVIIGFLSGLVAGLVLKKEK